MGIEDIEVKTSPEENNELELIMKQKELNAKIEMLLSANYIFSNNQDRLKITNEYNSLRNERDNIEMSILSLKIK